MGDLRKMLDNSKAVMAGVVGLLIIIPSVINSVGDIITSLRNLPIGEKEKIHVELMEKHWKENPVYTKQMQIAGVDGKLTITIDIYQNGDIRVDYGAYAQWFPYQKVKENNQKLSQKMSLSFFTKLYADNIEIDDIGTITTEVENIKEDENRIVRIRKFADGSIQKITLEKNTGKILRIDMNETTNKKSVDGNRSRVEVIKLFRKTSKPNNHKNIIEVIELK